MLNGPSLKVKKNEFLLVRTIDVLLANMLSTTFDPGKLTPVNFDKDAAIFDQFISCAGGQDPGGAHLKSGMQILIFGLQ